MTTKSTTTRATRSAPAAAKAPAAGGIDSAKAPAAEAPAAIDVPEVGEALSSLMSAGRDYVSAAIEAGEAREKSGGAVNRMIAALSQPGVMLYPLMVVVGEQEFPCTLGAPVQADFAKHPDGSDWTSFRTAYKAAVRARFFGIDSGEVEAKVESLMKSFMQTALPAAAALVKRGVTAAMGNEGKLVFSGDTATAEGRQNVEAMQKLGSAAKLSKQGNEDLGKKSASGGAGESTATKTLTKSELIEEAYKLARLVAEDKEALTNAALETLRKMAKLISANPRSFGAA